MHVLIIGENETMVAIGQLIEASVPDAVCRVAKSATAALEIWRLLSDQTIDRVIAGDLPKAGMSLADVFNRVPREQVGEMLLLGDPTDNDGDLPQLAAKFDGIIMTVADAEAMVEEWVKNPELVKERVRISFEAASSAQMHPSFFG